VILVVGLVTGCGDSGSAGSTEPAAPSATDGVPSEALPAAPSDPSEMAADAVENLKTEGMKTIQKSLEGAGDAASEGSSSTVDKIEMVARFLGIGITDETRPMLTKVAAMVDDEATRQQVVDAAKKVGIDPDDFSTDAIKSKLGLGGVGGDDEEEGDEEAGAERPRTRTGKRGPRKRRKDGTAPEAGAEGGEDPAADPGRTARGGEADLSGLDVPTLKARRDAEIKRLETDRDRAAAALADKFEAKKKADPSKAEVFDERMARQQKRLETDHDAKVEDVRTRYRTAIKAARAKKP
jgi:hypothetical protein